MNTARRPTSSLPAREPKSPPPSGQYRMVQPRTNARAAPVDNSIESEIIDMPMPRPQPARRRISGEYIDAPIAMPIPISSALPKVKSAPVKSAKPKAIALESLDDAFEDADSYPEEDAPEAPDSLVQMMEGLEGTRVKEEAWPKQMPAIPRPPSVPKMEAVRPPGALQPPISRMTPRPVSEHQVIEDFAKFGPAPETIWQTPGYAWHVRNRKAELKQELGLHRERRASDVDLYEKALRHVDDEAVRRGYMVMASSAVLGFLVIVIICMLL